MTITCVAGWRKMQPAAWWTVSLETQQTPMWARDPVSRKKLENERIRSTASSGLWSFAHRYTYLQTYVHTPYTHTSPTQHQTGKTILWLEQKASVLQVGRQALDAPYGLGWDLHPIHLQSVNTIKNPLSLPLEDNMVITRSNVAGWVFVICSSG